MSNTVRVFEHSVLPIGGRLTSARFDRLVQYNERHGNKFFQVGHKRIHFRNYVGVIQVGGLTIEILPKADREPESAVQKDKWQCALVEMLRRSGFIRLSTLSDARLRLHSASLLDIFFESFLAEVEDLVHQGLVRKYRQVQGNITALRGRILFSGHIARNLVHRERFYTEHTFYDRNNPYNQILGVALNVLARVCTNPHLTASARRQSLSFEGMSDLVVTEETFARLPHTRNSMRYRRALQLARLIILNYCPDVRGGRDDVLALLFDMNQVFERFVFCQIHRAAQREPGRRVACTAQAGRLFWTAPGMRKHIRPDIVVRLNDSAANRCIVLDTKWKVPTDGRPGDRDLQQMYAYNMQWGAQRSLLVYPWVSGSADISGRYSPSAATAFESGCGMCFLDLFDSQNRLRHDLGADILARLEQPMCDVG